MKTLIVDDGVAVGAATANLLADASAKRAGLVIGLPTGRTAIPLYDELAWRRQSGDIDLSKARAFNLDELMVPRLHAASFHSFMTRNAWGRSGLDRRRCDIPNGEADPDAECRRYEDAIREAGGLDIVVLGVGVDGHVAYNLPGVAAKGTHLVDLPESLADELGIEPEWRPLRAITMGLRTIAAARRVVVIASGRAKAPAIRALHDGPEDCAWPCSRLHHHADITAIVDRDAASLCPS